MFLVLAAGVLSIAVHGAGTSTSSVVSGSSTGIQQSLTPVSVATTPVAAALATTSPVTTPKEGGLAPISTTTAAPGCVAPIDAFFIQDTTGSFIPDIQNVKSQLPRLMTTIEQRFPGTRMGFGEFRDKPYARLGELNDYCYKLHSSLGNDVEKLQERFGRLWASGGGDTPEAQFHAIIDAVNDPFIGWRSPDGRVDSGSEIGARLVIISTDATPHDPGDYDLWEGGPTYLPPFPSDTTGISSTRLCRWYDYPSQERLKEQLRKTNTHLGILTPSLEDNVEPKVIGRWKEINERVLQQPASFYQFTTGNSSDFSDSFMKILEAVTAHVCQNVDTADAATVHVSTTATEEEPDTGVDASRVTQGARPLPGWVASDLTAVVESCCDEPDDLCCDDGEEGYNLVIAVADQSAQHLVVNYEK